MDQRGICGMKTVKDTRGICNGKIICTSSMAFFRGNGDQYHPFCLSPKNDPDINKEDGQSPSARHTIGGKPVSVW
jgi:hypothetical protein